MPLPRPFFLLPYLDGNECICVCEGGCFDILITQGTTDTDSHADWEWGNYTCFHPPLLAVK